MEHREYADDQIANALAVLRSNRGNLKKTALALGIPRSSLRGWAGRNAKSNGVAKRVDEPLMDDARTKLAVTFRSKAQELLDHVGEDKMLKAGARDLLIAAAIATDKAELLTGGPTARTESVRISLISPDVLRSGKLRVIEGHVRRLDVPRSDTPEG